MRYKGLTQSDFTPLLHDEIFQELNKWFIARNGDKSLVKEDASSRKLKTQQKMIAVIKKSFSPSHKVAEFTTAIVSAKNLTEQKRFYMSDYGLKSTLVKLLWVNKKLLLYAIYPQNYEKFHTENLIKWWKKKASNRYEKLEV